MELYLAEFEDEFEGDFEIIDDDTPEEAPIEEPEEPKEKYPAGTKAFADEINDDLLCPSQVYQYVEMTDDGKVRYVGYDDIDTYEQEEDDSTLALLFGEPVEEDTMTFDEQLASRIFGR